MEKNAFLFYSTLSYAKNHSGKWYNIKLWQGRWFWRHFSSQTKLLKLNKENLLKWFHYLLVIFLNNEKKLQKRGSSGENLCTDRIRIVVNCGSQESSPGCVQSTFWIRNWLMLTHNQRKNWVIPQFSSRRKKKILIRQSSVPKKNKRTKKNMRSEIRTRSLYSREQQTNDTIIHTILICNFVCCI